jgi:hypothetical protein
MKRQLICAAAAACLMVTTSTGVVRTEEQQHARHGTAPAKSGAVIEAVRAAIEKYRDVNVAIAAGYAQFQGCVSGPLEGAMGVHFAKGPLFDGNIDVRAPEVLVYEQRNGRLHLVAAEYIVPAEFWDPTHDESDKPHLMGQLFHYAPSPNRYGGGPFYELHVWAIKQNPRGAFADWNPNVSCAEWEGSAF